MLPHYLIFGFSETRQSLTLFDHCLQLRLGLQVQPHGFQSVVRHLGRIPPGRESAQLLAGACHARAQSSEKLATLSRYYRYRATAISASAAVARIVPQVQPVTDSFGVEDVFTRSLPNAMNPHWQPRVPNPAMGNGRQRPAPAPRPRAPIDGGG